MKQTDALLRLFFRVNPDELEDEEYSDLVAQMWFALESSGQVEKHEGKYRFVR